MRADQLLLQRELASSRSQAQRLIGAGVRWRLVAPEDAPWRRIVKNSDDVPHDVRIELLDVSEARYVSRGGLKLEGGLATSGVSAQDKVCLDVGQSTGGFTDCLLRHGAMHVVGIDVGTGQLHPSLRDHARVLALEQTNARDLDAIMLIANYRAKTRAIVRFDGENSSGDVVGPLFDLIVGDLSFISQTLVLPALVPLLKPGGDVLMLVKPQFELQPGQVGKGGIVKDVAMFAIVEARIREAHATLGLQVKAWFDSPINGGDGNREFFVHAHLPRLA